MRSIILLAGLFSLLTNISWGKDCKNYYFLQQNKTIEMTICNKKGDANGKQVYTVSNVTANGSTTNATVNSKMFSQKGKSMAKGHSEIIITYKSKITIKTMGIGMPFNIEGTEWFAPGFGIVKTESKYGGTAITAIK
jgi:hypothetical protein